MLNLDPQWTFVVYLNNLSSVTLKVSGTFDLFNVMCEHYDRSAFNSFLNGKEVTLTISVSIP